MVPHQGAMPYAMHNRARTIARLHASTYPRIHAMRTMHTHHVCHGHARHVHRVNAHCVYMYHGCCWLLFVVRSSHEDQHKQQWSRDRNLPGWLQQRLLHTRVCHGATEVQGPSQSRSRRYRTERRKLIARTARAARETRVMEALASSVCCSRRCAKQSFDGTAGHAANHSARSFIVGSLG